MLVRLGTLHCNWVTPHYPHSDWLLLKWHLTAVTLTLKKIYSIHTHFIQGINFIFTDTCYNFIALNYSLKLLLMRDIWIKAMPYIINVKRKILLSLSKKITLSPGRGPLRRVVHVPCLNFKTYSFTCLENNPYPSCYFNALFVSVFVTVPSLCFCHHLSGLCCCLKAMFLISILPWQNRHLVTQLGECRTLLRRRSRVRTPARRALRVFK